MITWQCFFSQSWQWFFNKIWNLKLKSKIIDILLDIYIDSPSIKFHEILALFDDALKIEQILIHLMYANIH